MKLDDLKALEQAATPGPWTIGTECLPNHNFENDANFIITLRNLAPELLALIEAVEWVTTPIIDSFFDDRDERIFKAWQALNAKLEAME